ncbi:MAG: hypothetical protein IPM53_03970 [Anaerolineaceae bacterium]|nr:hypothetical protein [Anaerolineaceae bacterium]
MALPYRCHCHLFGYKLVTDAAATTTRLDFILLGMAIFKQWRRKLGETAVTNPSTLLVNGLPLEQQ